MIPRAACLVSSLLACALVGCDSNSAPSDQPLSSGRSAQAAQTAASPGKEAARAFVRGVNVVPGGPDLRLQVDGQAAGQPVRFGHTSSFVAIAPGKSVSISVLSTSGVVMSRPLLVGIKSGDHLTVAANGAPGAVGMLVFNSESGGPRAGKSKIAFLHAARGLGAVEAGVGGSRFRHSVGYGQGTEYQVLEPGIQWLSISYERPSSAARAATTPRILNRVPPRPAPQRLRGNASLDYVPVLRAGKVYTMILCYDAARKPIACLLADRFADTLQDASKAN